MLARLSRDRLANLAMFLRWFIKEQQFLAFTPGIFNKKSWGPELHLSVSERVSKSAATIMAITASGCDMFSFSSSNNWWGGGVQRIGSQGSAA